MSQQNRQGPPQQSALAQRHKASAVELAAGTFTKIGELRKALETAEREANLVSPATSVGRLPEGTSIALTMVHVDISKSDKGYYADDTYDVGMGKRGLSKTPLFKIGAALGISWDPITSGRVDDGSDPYYCRWLAVAQYRAFDGQIQTLQGNKEMDLRENSPQVEGLYRRYEEALKSSNAEKRAKAKDPTGQIREMRIHIEAHAQTKAQLRALRSLGIKTSYTLEELARPFAVARIMFTGVTKDPALKTMFAEKIADSFLGGRNSLYGAAPVNTQTLSAPISHRFSAPPPVGSVPAEDDDWIDAPAEDTEPDRQARGQAEARGSAPANTNAEGGAPTFVIPGGSARGTPLAEATDKDLEYWSSRIARELDEGTSRDPSRDQAQCDALLKEIDRRAADKGKY